MFVFFKGLVLSLSIQCIVDMPGPPDSLQLDSSLFLLRHPELSIGKF